MTAELPSDPLQIAELIGPGERDALMELARATLNSAVLKQPADRALFQRCPELEMFGAFVTLKFDGRLRGCIGSVGQVDPVRDLVRRSAEASALSDPRFDPVSEQELDRLECEISLLTPLVEMARDELPGAVQVGRDGLLVEQPPHRGLLLPQVATERHWDSQTFLEETCVKANLPRDAWQARARVYKFSALIIGS